jgi:uncharacterized protein HemX
MPRRLRSSSAVRRFIVGAVCACAAVLPLLGSVPTATAAGIGGSGALSELTEGSPESSQTTTATTATTSTSSSESGIGNSVVYVGIGGAIVLIIGIGFFIMRDVRRVAPATDGEAIEAMNSKHTQAALRKRRAKAKAARQQRKRNR